MGDFGIRGSYGSAPDAAALRELGSGVAWVSLFCESFDQLDSMLAVLPPGIKVVVPANNQLKEVHSDWSGWQQAMKDFGLRFRGRVHIVTCGNELDLWHWQPPIGKPDRLLTPFFAAALVNVASAPLRAAGIKVAMSSVASGRWQDYLRDMAAACVGAADYADLHLYMKKIDGHPAYDSWQEAIDALNVARNLTGLPVLSSEAGIKIDDAGGEDAQAEWGRRLYRLARAVNGDVFGPLILFAYSDGVGTADEQGGQAFGMIAPDGRRKPLWKAIQKAAGGPQEAPTPPQPPEVTVITSGPNNAWIGGGLLAALNARGLTPTTGELSGEGGTAVVFCTGGVRLRWLPWEGRAYLERSDAA